MGSYIRTSDHIAITFDDGEFMTVYPSNPNFSKVRDALNAKNYDEARKLAAPPAKVVEKVIQKAVKRGVGSVQIRAGIVYYNDEPIHNSLAQRIVMMANEGFDIEPMTKFLANLQENPSYRAVNELYSFLEKGNLPITEDGYFLAYKRVRNDYKDIHSGTFDNSVGVVVEMPRNKVNEDPNQTCSHGLHFCSRGYLAHFGSDSGNRTMILKINPRDVVAVPTDYNDTKGRCCRYEVIGELEHRNEAPLEGTFRPSDKYVAPIEVDEDDVYGDLYEDDEDYDPTDEDYKHAVDDSVPMETEETQTSTTDTKVIAIDASGGRHSFGSIQEAANWAMLSPSAIRRVLKGDRKRAGGYEWKYETIPDAHPAHLANMHEHGTLKNGQPHMDDIDDDYYYEDDEDGFDHY